MRRRERVVVRVVEECLAVLEAPGFFGLNLFEVVGVDVVPELALKGLVGVVLDVGLLVRNLEIGPA